MYSGAFGCARFVEVYVQLVRSASLLQAACGNYPKKQKLLDSCVCNLRCRDEEDCGVQTAKESDATARRLLHLSPRSE